MTTLLLAQAQAIVSATLAEARRRGAQPLAVVVLDAGGHPVTFAREDGATFFRHEIALSKAVGALGMGIDTRVLAQRAASNPAFFQSLSAALGGRVAYSPGGVLIHHNGVAIGAVGVSGDTGDCDEECARAGLAGAGLTKENLA